jgi:hypothetical protein
VGCALIERIAQQRPGVLHVAAMKGVEPLMDQRFGLALLLGLRAPGALDVGPGSVMMPVEEQDARPQIDGRFEVAGEVLIEAGDEQVLDARVLGGRTRTARVRRLRRLRIGHNLKCCTV